MHFPVPMRLGRERRDPATVRVGLETISMAKKPEAMLRRSAAARDAAPFPRQVQPFHAKPLGPRA